MSPSRPRATWHISSYSADNGGSCVEAGPLCDGSGRVAVRHSKAPDAATIVYAKSDWATFVLGIKTGEFDRGRATARRVG